MIFGRNLPQHERDTEGWVIAGDLILYGMFLFLALTILNFVF